MNEQFDVAIIGMGPSGLTLAAALARRGHNIIIAERHPHFYGDPRAGHIDHEIVRILHALEAAGPTMEIAVPVTSYAWRNQHGELLIDFTNPGISVSGYHSDYMQFQPVMENALVDKIKPAPNVTFLQGWELIDFEQDADGVDFTLRGFEGVGAEEGKTRQLRASYLVGADGANSFVRNTLSIARNDLGFKETWLDVDVKVNRPLNLETPCGQICDPKRPKVILPLGKHYHRWEWAVLESDDQADLLRPEKAWELLAEDGVGPDDVEIIRQILYTFTSFLAQQWRVGRVMLSGDSAHTQPPFMGQGMCSGVRDSINLAWKLDMVLRGVADDALFDSYQAERYAHTRDWTIVSIMSGEVSCVYDEAKAAERDALFKSGFVPPMPEQPYLKAGVIDADSSEARALVGRLVLNAPVNARGRTDLFDNLFYNDGWILLTNGPTALLDTTAREILASIGTAWVSIGGSDCDAVDIEGKYGAYFAEHGVDAIIMRPDFYVFGAAKADGLSDLVQRLAHRFRKPVPAVNDDDQMVTSVADAWA